VFRTLQEAGRVGDEEMFRTFNMGIGYVVVVRPDAADSVATRLTAAGEAVAVIGEVVAGERGVELIR
jgi:phosphoribosylformylglycinamidine cyclo-ligase